VVRVSAVTEKPSGVASWELCGYVVHITTEPVNTHEMDIVGNTKIGFTEYITENKTIIRSKMQWSKFTLIT
jgi:hypothetical protein